MSGLDDEVHRLIVKGELTRVEVKADPAFLARVERDLREARELLEWTSHRSDRVSEVELYGLCSRAVAGIHDLQ